MKRLHLFELEDQPWLPATIRDSMTDYLGFLATLSDVVFRGFAQKLAAAIDRTHDTNIVEMGPGGGGPAIPISRHIRHLGHPHLKLVLTDLYPNVERLRIVTAKCDVPIEVVDTGERHRRPVLLFVTPFLRPFRISRLVLTYLVPVIPLCVLWDGIASCLRVYSPDDLRSSSQAFRRTTTPGRSAPSRARCPS